MRFVVTQCRLTVLLLFCSALTLLGQIPSEIYQGREVAAHEVLVKFRAPNGLAVWQAQTTGDIDEDEPVGNIPDAHRVHSRGKTADTLLQELSSRADVAYAEPNYIVHINAVPNDANFSSLWGMQNISATSAWEISTGSLSNVVAVVDSGIDYNHPDLALNVWSAPASFTVTIGGKKITCAAGTHGFNTILRTCDPMDDNNHGTHVSGTIGALGNNGLGVAGVNWTAQIMAVKFLDKNGSGTTANAINAIEFAIQAKAAFTSTNAANVRVLSNSWGGSAFSQALLDEINKANTNELLFVAAAGNSAANNDVTPTYPASFTAPNIVAVAANDNPDALAYFSDYGPASVHLSAPGVDVLSTIPGGAYEYDSGTSMATPHVSGAALLVLSRCTLNTASLKNTLLNNVDLVPALAGTTITGGRLNVDKAIRACTQSPSAYTLTAKPATVGAGGATVVSWTTTTGRPSNDWIAVYPAGTPNTTYGWYQYTGGASSGSFTVAMPSQAGQYEFRYLAQNGFADEIRSNPVTVSASIITPVVSAAQASNIKESSATITWSTSVASDSQVDYGLDSTYGSSTVLDPSKVTSHNVALSNLTQSTLYHYRVKSADANGDLGISGDLTFTTPMSSAGFSVTAAPASVALGGALTVNWTAPAGRPTNDWVGLYQVGAPNSPSIWWQYTNGAASGSATLTAPNSLGQYEFRYLLQGGYTDIVRSNTVTVTAAGFSLTADPASLSAGASLTVTWAAPSGRPTNDWVGLYQVGAPSSPAIWWQYTNGATSGSATTTAPASPGQYEFRYFLQGGYTDVIHSNAVTVSAALPPTVSAVQAGNITAATATITWTTNVAANSQVDYGPTAAYGSSPTLDPSKVTAHSVALSGLTASTFYHYRVKSSDALGNQSVSGDFNFTTLSASAGYTLVASPASVALGDSVTVTWTAPAGRPTNDWVGLYQVGAPNSPAIWWQYTNGAANGSASITAPNSPGPYEFRYLLQGGYTDIVRSNTVTVTAAGFSLTATPASLNPGGSLTVTWAAPAGRPTTDWVGLYQVGAPSSPAIWWQYTNGTTSGSATTTAPASPGQYEFRYFLQGGYSDVAHSNVVNNTLSGSFTLTATPATVSPGGALAVSWTAPSGRPANDWVGLFLVGSPNTAYTWYQFTNGATSGSFNLSAPAATGQYEFRYLLQNGYSDTARSNAVSVQ